MSGHIKEPVKGADVLSVPPSQQVVTDETGIAMLQNLEPVSYEIYAKLEGYGSGQSVVTVASDSVNNVNIVLIMGKTVDFTPEIDIILPGIPANFYLNEKIVFSIDVYDNNSEPDEIDVIISSNLDGTLLKGHPDAYNNVKFETSSLSVGMHTITITAIDKDKYSTTKTFELSSMTTDPAEKIYYYTITDAVHHPSQPIVYIVDNATQKLRAINYRTQTEINSISLNGSVGKIDIGDNGFGIEIYVPDNNGHIKVYNAGNLNLVTTINTGFPTNCVVTNGHGYLVASLDPSPGWEMPVRTYSRSKGFRISGNTGIVYKLSMLRFIPNTDNIISISTTVVPEDMNFFELDSTGIIISNNDDIYHGDYPLDPNIFKISSNGEFVITGKSGAVYGASSSMIYIGMVERGTLYFSDFAFSEDGNTIYAGTSNRNSIQIIKYPELTRFNEVLLKGYPKFLFYYDGEIISVSKTDKDSTNYIFETIKIE
jgi:hypothetical protein